MIFLLSVIGACIGSFLNVCIYRLPKDASIVQPNSYCPNCKKPISWFDNIPVLSYLLLLGKCRNCKEKISFRYPLVELLAALAFVVLYLQFGISVVYFKFLFFFLMLIVVSFIDIDYHAIPAYLCVLGIFVGLIFEAVASWEAIKMGLFDINYLPIVHSFIGLIVGLGFSYFFKLFGDVFISAYLSFRKKGDIEGETESLGLGDVDFLGMVGVFLGWKLAILTFFIAPLFGLVYSVYAISFKKSHLIPYLPYLSLGTIVAFFWGHKIISLVLY